MKKTYIQPAVEIFDITVNTMILEISKPEITEKPVVPRSNEHRGDWDNIWGE